MARILVPTKQDETVETFRSRDHGLEDVARKAAEVVGRAAWCLVEDGRIVGVWGPKSERASPVVADAVDVEDATQEPAMTADHTATLPIAFALAATGYAETAGTPQPLSHPLGDLVPIYPGPEPAFGISASLFDLPVA